MRPARPGFASAARHHVCGDAHSLCRGVDGEVVQATALFALGAAVWLTWFDKAIIVTAGLTISLREGWGRQRGL